VEADFSVELGSDDERLEVPWAAPDGSCQYFDLSSHPDLITRIEEAQREPVLSGLLLRMNSRDGALRSAKCDVWSSSEINPEEEIFGLAMKYCSYVDLLFAGERRLSFPANEQLAKQWTQLLRKAPELPASAEFLIRRCRFHEEAGEEDGFYITAYVFGFGDDEQSARQQWQIGLQLLENAIRQCAR